MALRPRFSPGVPLSRMTLSEYPTGRGDLAMRRLVTRLTRSGGSQAIPRTTPEVMFLKDDRLWASIVAVAYVVESLATGQAGVSVAE